MEESKGTSLNRIEIGQQRKLAEAEEQRELQSELIKKLGIRKKG